MAGIKIINVLKDDTFPDILELFRRTDASEVIFVLPKTSRIFRSEDHFAAFASEASTAGKLISILCSNATTTSLARKYGFQVMSSGTAPSKPKKTKAVLASVVPPADPDIQDYNEDAFQSDVPMTSDETMGIKGQDEGDDNADPLHGMHIEEEEEEKKEVTGETQEEQPASDELTYGSDFIAAPAGKRTATTADLDYIDTVWREKAGKARPALKFNLPKVNSVRLSKSVMLGILAVSVITLGGVVYLTTGAADVTITPVAQELNSQISVQASDVFSSVDANFGKLPGQLFQVSKTATREAQATGQREVASKARGTITISNSYSSSPQPLVATTRFASADGLVFRTLQSVTVPGSSVSNGTLVPGTVTVQVVADKPGEQYDIPAGTFTIMAFKERGDTDRAAKITGSSTTAFSGGASGPSAVVTQADYDAAKEAAIAAVTEDIKNAFAQQAGDLMVLSDIKPVIASIQSSVQPDDAATSFTVTATGTLRTVAFRKADLDSLITQTMLKKERLTVVPEKLTLSYGDIAFKPDTGTLGFTVSLKGNGYAPLDDQAIATDIKGMNAARIHDYFSAHQGVASAAVSLSPFWVRSVPSDSSRIHLRLDY